MDADDGDKVIVMNRPKPQSLLDQILSPASKPAAAVPPRPADPPPEVPPSQEPAKKADPRPRPGDPYRANAQFLNRLEERQVMIHFVARDCIPRGFAYAYLEGIWFEPGDQPGGGLDLVMRFGGTKPTDVRIRGRNLDGVYDYISRHTMPWVWERPPGRYADNDAATVITGISFHPVEK
jgi:hypothetical protein